MHNRIPLFVLFWSKAAMSLARAHIILSLFMGFRQYEFVIFTYLYIRSTIKLSIAARKSVRINHSNLS